MIAFLRSEQDFPQTELDAESLFQQHQQLGEDLQDVKAQEHVKRALDVAAAGGHNLLMLGPPGSGKTMLDRRMVSILPPPSFDEALAVAQIHSIAGLLPADRFSTLDPSEHRTTPFRQRVWLEGEAFRGQVKFH